MDRTLEFRDCPRSIMGNKSLRSYLSDIKFNVVIFAVLLCVSISCYAPFALGMSLDGFDATSSRRYHPAYNLTDLGNSAIIALSVFMLFETFMDANRLNIPFFLNLIRTTFLLGMMASSFAVLASAPSMSIERVVSLRLCTFYFQILCTSIPFMEQVAGSSQDRSWKMVATITVVMAVALTGLYLVLLEPFNQSLGRESNLIVVVYILIVANISILTVLSIRGYIARGHENEVSGTMKYRIGYSLGWGGYMLIISVTWLSFGSRNWTQTTDQEYFCYKVLHMIAMVLIHKLPTQIARFDEKLTTHKIAAKKHFVRYISHELRTPLNVIYIALQMMVAEETARQDGRAGEGGIVRAIDRRSDSTIRETAEESLEACTVAMSILDDLLMYDRIEEGGLSLVQEDVDLVAFVNRCVNLFHVQARGAGVTLILCPLRIEGMEVELAAPSKLFAPIDETKMAQVIRNLVSNAIKFTQAGGSVEVRMTFHPSSSSSRKSRQRTAPSISRGHARVEIVDTGCGVSAAQQKDLFKKDRQFNTANSHGATGSGLGLFISNAIVLRHGGTLGVKSSGIVGEGSVFYFDIPGFVRLRREDDVSRGTDKQERHSLSSPGPQELSTAATVQMIALSGAENNFSSMSSSSVIIEHRDSYEAPAAGATSEILILGADAPSLNMEGKIALVVDDSKLNRKMIMKLINDKFEVILEAENGETAVAAALQCRLEHQQDPDVIFMDHEMPVLTGLEAVRRLREADCRSLILMVTGHVLEDDVKTFIDAGADRVLAKPVNVAYLFDILSKGFSARLMQQNNRIQPMMS